MASARATGSDRAAPEPESFTLSQASCRVAPARAEADGDPYAAQHQMRRRQTIIDPDGVERMATVNAAGSPLARHFALKLMDAAQFAAGERQRRDYPIAQLAPRSRRGSRSAQLSFGRRGEEREHLIADTVLAAKQRFRAAMVAVGPGLNDLLYDVCCALMGIEEAERQFGWPSRSAKVVLGLALDRLALHYGLIVTAPARGRMRSWVME